ncbi:MAG: hypothetical protein IT447_16265 [Phycisphaerales bacterium]|jgi:hypothetical protein|nr:hypothetical protein [Phycisphaerales bacterium]
MSVATLTLDGKKYAIIPIEQYRKAFDQHGVRVLRDDEMTEQDRGDVAELKRRKAAEKAIPYSKARKTMGLKGK